MLSTTAFIYAPLGAHFRTESPDRDITALTAIYNYTEALYIVALSVSRRYKYIVIEHK